MDWRKKQLAFPDHGWGQCINCGFLTKRAASEEVLMAGYAEATGVERTTGKLWSLQGHHAMPWCFLRITRFWKDEIQPTALPGDSDPGNARGAEFEEAAHIAITRLRDCESFYPWQEGLSPKEHYEEFRMLELEGRREEFELRTERDRREFEERLAERAEKAEGRRHNVVLWVAGAAVILALAEVGTAIVGAGPGSLIGKLLGLD